VATRTPDLYRVKV